ncbi:hypothetical protein SORBI_3002G397700 [Sorghum bicolor]|uniref:Uncharacterized protein n=1 Tax=Sorghum bicolor TaxID=4558 RepID=A0A1B6QG01_SORBI|nr:hypothetical protein SORBI_3002G397700 [Sorghum bicolor]
MPDNPKVLVFESTQQRYEVPLRQRTPKIGL